MSKLRTFALKLWKKTDWSQKTIFLCLLILALFMALPIIFIVNHAFKPINELFMYPPRFFVRNPTLDNFSDLLMKSQSTVVPFSRYLFNSLLTTASTLIAVILFSAMAAYALSKHRFPGSGLVFAMTIFALMFAPESVAIPRYLVIANIGIMDTYFAHILPFVAAPVSVFLIKQFVDQLPNELLEAAKIDGAKEWQLFVNIVLPMCMPALATVSILTFQVAWSQSETSNLFTTTESMKTLPYYVLTLTSGLANNFVGQGPAAAAGLIMFLPNLIIFLLAQRNVIATMAHSGIK